MAKKQTMYLETSVISAYFDFWKGNPSQRRYTRQFWEKIVPHHHVYISDICLQELSQAQEEWYRNYLGLVRDIEIITDAKTVNDLAKQYVSAGIIPKNKLNDASHLAVASLHRMDFLVSWNQEHIVRPHKIHQVIVFNKSQNIHIPTIVKPSDFL